MERLERIPKYEHAAELASSLKPQIDSWVEKGRPIHEGKILVVNLLAEALNYCEGSGKIMDFEDFKSFSGNLGSIFSEYAHIDPHDGIYIKLEGSKIDHKLSAYSWLPGENFPFCGKIAVRFEIFLKNPFYGHYGYRDYLTRFQRPEIGGVEFSLSGEDLTPEIIPFGYLEVVRNWHQFQKNFENNEAATLEIIARLIYVDTLTLVEMQKGRM